MVDTEKFDRDLNSLFYKMAGKTKEAIKEQLSELKDRLIQLNKENLVKINHSVMELICSQHLLLKGYDVQVEHQLENMLICDLYAEKGYGSLVVEVETGYIPPQHALGPSTYTLARLASKIIRYSIHAEKFALGVPTHYILRFPETLILPPRYRKLEDIKSVKNLCDMYYKKPPIHLDEVKYARIHCIYIIDVDQMKVEEVDPETYIKSCESFQSMNHQSIAT
jgi:hypothetical protein